MQNQAVKQNIRDHINSIQRIESHYLRNQTKREFIDGSLNISTLYRYYREKCDKLKQNPGSKYIYQHIFNTDFKISLHTPKKDQCSFCTSFKNTYIDGNAAKSV